MGAKKQSSKLALQMSAEQLAGSLEVLAAGLRSGAVTIPGDPPVVLRTGAPVRLKLDAKSDNGKASLSLKLSWEPEPETESTADESEGELHIPVFIAGADGQATTGRGTRESTVEASPKRSGMTQGKKKSAARTASNGKKGSGARKRA